MKSQRSFASLRMTTLVRTTTLVGTATALASLLGPALAAAQAPEQTAFYLIRGKDTLIAERMSRTPTELRGEFADRVRGGVMQYVAALTPDSGISKLSTHYFRTADDKVGDTASFTINGDKIVVQLGAAAPVTIPGISGAIPIINPSVAFLEQVVMHAKAMHQPGQAGMAVFVLGAPQPLPAMVTFIGTDSATLAYAGVSMRFHISPTGQILGGVVPAQQVWMVRAPATTGPLVTPRRDYSAPPGAPYTAEDVRVRTPAGMNLTGTLTLPTPRDRRAAPRRSRRQRIRRWSAGRDVRRFRGRHSRRDRYLRSRPEIDGARIGIVRHSEGAGSSRR